MIQIGSPGLTHCGSRRGGFPCPTLKVRSFYVLAIAAVAIVGCNSGLPSAGTFFAESKPVQLTPGQKQDIELTVQYRLAANPAVATTVSYSARMTGPDGWSIAPSHWAHSHTMKTTDIGFNETRKLSITVPADAVPGGHVTTLVLSPASGPAQSLDLRFAVVSQGN